MRGHSKTEKQTASRWHGDTDIVHQTRSLTLTTSLIAMKEMRLQERARDEKWDSTACHCVWRVYLCALEYTCVYPRLPSCVSTSQCLSKHLHACACVCVCICWHMCTCAVSMCVCSIQLETSNPTFLFHCLNERVKSLLVVITVINDFFSAFPPMKSTLTSSTFPSAVGCGLFCKEIPLFMFKWVLHYVLLFNHWPFYALHFPWVYMCAWVFLCAE